MTTIEVDNSFDPLVLASPYSGVLKSSTEQVPYTIAEGVDVVDGDFGKAWRFTDSLTIPGLLFYLDDLGVSGEEGTILIRYHAGEPGVQHHLFSIGRGDPGESRITLNTISSGDSIAMGFRNTNDVHQNTGVAAIQEEWTWASFRWIQGNIIGMTPVDTVLRANFNGGPFIGDMRLAATSNKMVMIEAVAVYGRALTNSEILPIVEYQNQITWDVARVRRIDTLPVTLPDYESSIYAIESELFITDRENRGGVDVSNAITDIAVDMDIDRYGGKSRCTVEAYSPVVQDGDWIAPYLTLTPEVGEIVRSQMGHYFLDAPNMTYDGTGAENVRVAGVDHVQLLAESSPGETFYTPVRGQPVEDVRVLLKMATCGVMGQNRVTNSSFEGASISGWTTWFRNGNGTIDGVVANQTPVPDGASVGRTVITSGSPAGNQGSLIQRIELDPGDRFIYASGLSYNRNPSVLYANLALEFRSNTTVIETRSFRVSRDTGDRWLRHFGTAEVPVGADNVRVFATAFCKTAGAGEMLWDDIHVGVCTHMSIPDSMIALPESTVAAPTRIQHTIEDSFYTAINDRLTGTGHQAIQVDNKGVFTTRSARDVENDQPKRIYSLGGDSEVVGDVDVRRSTNNRYNRVVVTKESYEGDDLSAIAVNDDPDDRWSVENSPVRTQYVAAQSAVDQESVDILAAQFIARASMQEDLSLSVLPDPEITAYDTIRIEGEGAPDALGNWGLESVKWGMTAENPLVTLGARRTIGSGRNVS